MYIRIDFPPHWTAWMPEWSKGPHSSCGIYECVGSTPTSCNAYFIDYFFTVSTGDALLFCLAHFKQLSVFSVLLLCPYLAGTKNLTDFSREAQIELRPKRWRKRRRRSLQPRIFIVFYFGALFSTSTESFLK